jgi:hypothetical protein
MAEAGAVEMSIVPVVNVLAPADSESVKTAPVSPMTIAVSAKAKTAIAGPYLRLRGVSWVSFMVPPRRQCTADAPLSVEETRSHRA